MVIVYLFLFSGFGIYIQKQGVDVGPIDLDQTTVTFEPDQSGSGGLHIPGKDRVVFRPPPRKSLLGIFQNCDFYIVGFISLFILKLRKEINETNSCLVDFHVGKLFLSLFQYGRHFYIFSFMSLLESLLLEFCEPKFHQCIYLD